MSEFDIVKDYVRTVQIASRLDDLKGETEAVVKALGFDFFAILHHLEIDELPDHLVRFGNYPDGFRETVRLKRYVSDDPVLIASQRVAHGFLWSDVPKMMELTERQKEIISLGAREGLGDGFTVPVHMPGEFLGSSSFGVRIGREIREASLPMLHYIGSFAFEAARRIAMLERKRAHILKQESATLTERQLECIALIGAGHSAKSAAAQLGIKQDTVQKHLEEAKQRLGLRTSVELVIRALFDGRITFNDVLANKTERPS
jgi:LuxR family quorum-sensing system transcriptional regulator CciR